MARKRFAPEQIVAILRKVERSASRSEVFRRQSLSVTHKRVERLWRQEGLPLPRRRRRKRTSAPSGDRPPPGQPSE